MAQLLGTSRFIKTPLIKTRDGKDTYSIIEGFESLKKLSGENFQYYVVENCFVGRVDLIANNFYGDSHLEWVIVLANSPKNPLNWPAAGASIKIPNNTYVRSLF